jgi:hypothetical protein
LVIDDNSSEASLTFSLPSKCSLKEKLKCSAAGEGGVMDSVSDTDDYGRMPPEKHGISSTVSASASSLHLKRKLSKVPLVLTEVRRSDRLKGKSLGYKGDSCQGRNCLCCSTNPPTLSRRVIRKLGNEFCKIAPVVLSDETLLKKPVKKKAAVAKISKTGKGVKD